MSFNDLVGNENVKKILIDSAKSNKILHSYLFYGTEGIGKKVFATEFAKMILCENQDSPCNKCKSCMELNSNNHPDFFIIEPEGSSIKIEQIRNMQKNILEKPIISSKKIYVINDADKMTKESQNCLLKTLEDPQDFIVIILICSNENNILPTIKSRCVKLFFKKLHNNELVDYFNKNNINVNLDENMLELCNGSIKKAVDISKKQDILIKLKEITNSIDKIDKLSFFKYNEFFFINKDDIFLLLEYMYVLMYKYINSNNRLKCINSMSYIEEAKGKLLLSNNYDMTIDNMLIKVWEEFNEKNNRRKV